MKTVRPYMFTICALLVCSNIAFAGDDRPNIVLIMCDDLGYADVGFNGSKDIPTPNLDQLAQNATVFSSAYVAHPFCGPSRAALMTGRYPHRFGSQFNLPESGEDTEPIGGKLGIPLEEKFFSRFLRDAGYFTGLVGKWHLGNEPEYHPRKRGFDDFYGFTNGGHSYFPSDYVPKHKRLKKTGQHVPKYFLPLEHNGKEVSDPKQYLTDELSQQGARFIREASQKDQPFFLFLSYNAPHTPMQAKKEDLEKLSSIKDEKRRTYAAMVHAVDRGVEGVVNALKETKEFENTLIVFLSDNGGVTRHGANNFPLRGIKGDTWEGGYRTPMFFHWPGKVPQQVFPHTVTALDFYPTFTSLSKASVPDSIKLDGKDIMQHVVDGTDPRKSEPFFVMRHRGQGNEIGVRLDKWKLFRRGNSWKLFDLESDIEENNDLSSSNPDQLDSMIRLTADWSETHIEPKWFDSHQARNVWVENKRPNFERTFSRVLQPQSGN